MADPAPEKSVFEYENYREFLRDEFAARKREDKKFSYRFFARLVGIQAHSFVIRVVQGKVDLSSETIDKFARGLKLNKEETAFFRSLVRFNQAKSTEEKSRFAREILTSRAYRKINPLVESQYRFYSNWYYTPIRELVCLPDFKEDHEWIASKVIPAISPREAKRALDELLALGLLKRNESGRLVQTSSIIATEDEVSSAAIAQYHREMMKLAGESIDRFPREERAIMAQTFGVSEEGAMKIKDMIRRFRREIFEVVAQEREATSVFQLNIHLFPLALPPEDGSET